MLKWLCLAAESFAFSLLSRPNKSVQKAQLRDCMGRGRGEREELDCLLPLLVVVSMKID